MDLQVTVKPTVFRDYFGSRTIILSIRGLETQVLQYGLLNLTPREKRNLLTIKQKRKGRKKLKTFIVGIVLAQY